MKNDRHKMNDESKAISSIKTTGSASRSLRQCSHSGLKTCSMPESFENNTCDLMDLNVYRYLFEFAEELFFVLNESGIITHVNRAVIDLLGYPEEEIVGREFIFLHPNDRHEEAASIFNDIVCGKRDFCSIPLISKKGRIISAEHRVIKVCNYDRPVFLSISRNIADVSASEARFSKLFYSDIALISISSLRTGNFIEVNDAFLKTLGYNREEVIGRNCDDLELFEDKKERNEGIKRLKKEGFIRNIEGRIWTKSRDLRNCIFSSDIIELEEEACILTVIMDITDSKKAEKARVDAESKYRLLFERSMDAVAMLSGKPPKFTLVNSAFERLVGYSCDEILAFSFEEMWRIVHPEDVPIVKARLAARFGGDDVPSRYEYRVVRKTGEVRWVEVSANILVTEDGNNLALNIYRDITERKQAEELLKNAETRYRLLFENSIDALAIISGNPPLFKQVNRSFLELFGYSSDEVLGFSADELYRLVHPDDRDMVMKRLWARFNGESPPARYEFRILNKCGETRWVDVSTSLFNLNGENFSQVILREITDRKKAEKALRDRESYLRAIFDTSGAGILVVDTDGRVSSFNKKMEDLFLCEEGQLHSMSYADLVHPDNRGKGNTSFNNLLNGRVDSVCTERHYRRMDGSDFWGVVNARRLLNPEGETEGLLGVISDITEMKIAEDLLVEREAFLNAVIENLPFDMWAIDKNCRYILQNETSRANWGDMIGKTQTDYSQIADQETLDKWVSNNTRALKGERISEEARYRLDGRNHYYINALNPVLKKDSIIGVIGMNIDITDRRITEELIKSRLIISEYADSNSVSDILQKAVDEIEKLTESSIGFCHFVSEIDKTITLQAWSTNTLTIMCSVAPEKIHLPMEKAGVWSDCILMRRPVIHNYYESLAHKKGLPVGHAPIIRELLVPVFNGDHIVAVIGVGNKAFDYDDRDISIVTDLAGMIWDVVLRKRAEEERLELEKRLLHTQKLESLGVMAGGIAHDFNNLLMAIIGNLEFSLMEMDSANPVVKNIDQAIIASRRAADLTRQMLAYSGKGHFLISRLSLSDLVKENAGIFKTVIPKTVELRLDLMEKIPSISADAGQIQQIVMNLITNASESIEGNSGEIIITTGIEELDAEYLKKSRIDVPGGPGFFVFLEVTDTGCGMDDVTLNRIFDPFFTTKFTGRGLGMSAVLGIVKGHMGAVIVESRPAYGTSIKIFFPLKEDTSPDIYALDNRVKAGAYPIKNGKLLIVDDEEMILKICRNALEKKGFSILSASDGEEAVSVFKNNSSDIQCVVLDLKMPRMDGISAFREIRKIKPDTRVILTSGYSETEATDLFADEGLDGFIQKPYQIRELIDEIGRCLN